MPVEWALGANVRALRRGQHLTRAELARRLGISASYLNLIEHNRRGFPADLLVKLAGILPVDLKTMSPEHGDGAVAELMEVLGDPLFENVDRVPSDELRELAVTHPAAVQAMLRLRGVSFYAPLKT